MSGAVVLSKGAYIVRESDAETILAAINGSERHVLVEADLLGDGVHVPQELELRALVNGGEPFSAFLLKVGRSRLPSTSQNAVVAVR